MITTHFKQKSKFHPSELIACCSSRDNNVKVFEMTPWQKFADFEKDHNFTIEAFLTLRSKAESKTISMVYTLYFYKDSYCWTHVREIPGSRLLVCSSIIVSGLRKPRDF